MERDGECGDFKLREGKGREGCYIVLSVLCMKIIWCIKSGIAVVHFDLLDLVIVSLSHLSYSPSLHLPPLLSKADGCC